MNSKQLTFLLVIGIALGGLGWLAYQKQRSPYAESSARLGAKVLPDFPLNDVTQITIRQAKGTLTLARPDDIWVVKDRGNHPANFSNIKDLLVKLADLKVAKPVKVGASRLPQLELVAPDKGPGTLLEFADKSGKPLGSVLLGARSMREAGGEMAAFGGGSFPNGRYVMVGNDLKTVALVTEPFSSAEPQATDWLNKDWFKVEKLKSISVVTTNATNNFKLSRETEAGEWKLADAKPGEQLDAGKSGGVTSAFSSPSFNDIATTNATGLDKPVVATLETFDGLTYVAKVGAATGDENHYFQFTVTGNFPKERTPGKDEKPEDKVKLDADFKANLAKLEERLKTEKAFEKWTYLVAKWTVDGLLKERKDLLAEKKEEAKKEDALTPKLDPLTPKLEAK